MAHTPDLSMQEVGKQGGGITKGSQESTKPGTAGHAEQDTFVNKAHSEKLHGAYAGDKNLITFEGDHNSHRPQFFYTSVLFFLKTVLQMPVPEQAAAETAASASGYAHPRVCPPSTPAWMTLPCCAPVHEGRQNLAGESCLISLQYQSHHTSLYVPGFLYACQRMQARLASQGSRLFA